MFFDIWNCLIHLLFLHYVNMKWLNLIFECYSIQNPRSLLIPNKIRVIIQPYNVVDLKNNLKHNCVCGTSNVKNDNNKFDNENWYKFCKILIKIMKAPKHMWSIYKQINKPLVTFTKKPAIKCNDNIWKKKRKKHYGNWP